MPRLSQPRTRLTAYDLEADLPPRMPATELIAADLPERQIVLDPILATKSLALLYGPRGVGKTFVALGIAWAVASGGSFLGWRANRPHRVLYVDGEMAAVDMQQRLKLHGVGAADARLHAAPTSPGRTARSRLLRGPASAGAGLGTS